MSNEPVYDLKSGKQTPFFVPKPSPWPFLGAMAAGTLAVSAVLYMHHIKLGGFHFGLKEVGLGFLCVLAVMWVWWRDVIKEAFVDKSLTKETTTGLRYGMALFISSEVMFFVAFFWAFFNSSLFPKAAIDFTWPPKGIAVTPAFDLPFMMTMILLLSGCAVTWAHHCVLENKKDESVKALAVTVGLGLFFTCCQAFEYYHATYHFTGGIYPSTFFMATGFHGLHVIIGSIFLTVCLFRAAKGHFSKERHFGLEAAAWYWHFVDVVWLFLFICIYWWGNS